MRSEMTKWLLRYIDIEKSGGNESFRKYILTKLGESKNLLKNNRKISTLKINEWDLLFLYAYLFTQNNKWNFVESIIEMAVEIVSKRLSRSLCK